MGYAEKNSPAGAGPFKEVIGMEDHADLRLQEGKMLLA
jgi:hypothetical protein